MEEVISILMDRDCMSYEDAKSLVNETIDEMICNPDDAFDIIRNYLGLEPDYIENLI